MTFFKVCQMKGKRKVFDIPKIFDTIIFHTQQTPIKTLIKVVFLKVIYFDSVYKWSWK